jgi:hypothetical protein
VIDLALAILLFPAYLLYGPVSADDPDKNAKRTKGWVTSLMFWWLAWLLIFRRWF